jgi:diamine N-acetyltransferase
MSQLPLQTPPFLAEHTALGTTRAAGEKLSDVTLVRLPMREATDLGLSFAAIDPWARYPYPAAKLAAYFGQGDHSTPMLAVQIDARTVGVIGLRLNWLCGPYLQFLGFLPPYQSMGLGTMALTWLDAQTKLAGQRNVFVAASDFNTAALRFYERHGYDRIGTLKGLVRDDRDEILLHKKL